MANEIENQKQLDKQSLEHALSICASFNMRKATRMVTLAFDERLKTIGLRSTQLAILIMVASRGPITMTKLGHEMALTPSTLSRNLKLLSQKNYVNVTKATGRSKAVALTDKGLEIVKKAIPVWQQAQQVFTKHVGEENWTSLLSRLDEMTIVMQKKGPNRKD